MTALGMAGSENDRWKRRRGLAVVLRVVVVLAPVIVATGIGLLVARALPAPEGVGQTVAWWSVVLVSAVAALLGFDRLFRRLLPLSALLELALAFPGVAPSRFSSAFRAGTARNLQRRIDEAKAADGADASEAAGTVVQLIAALAAHDPRTRGHSERTRAYAELIGEELGLESNDLDRLRWSALLHDIGKLHVEPTLLNKAGKPDPVEWEVLRQHPIEGARIAGALRHWLGSWGMAIEQHHERFDGTGYPAGLAGEAISLGGRIVSVADAYEVMTSARSYTPAVAPAAAREELVRCAGNHFDPVIVRAFLRIAIGRFPKGAGLLVALGQVPGFLAAQRVFERAGSTVVAGAVGVALVASGAISPSANNARPSDEMASSSASSDADGDGDAVGSASFTAPVLPKTATAPTTTTLPTTADVAALDPGQTAVAAPSVRLPPPPGIVVTTSTTTSSPPTAATVATAPTTTTTATTTTASTSTTTTTPSTTTTAAATTTTTAPAARRGYFLGGTTAGTSPTPAPLTADRPSGTGAPDYDADGQPGRTLSPSPQPTTTTAVTEHQIWAGRFTGPALVTGTPVLTLPSAVSGFGSGRGNLRAALLDCDVSGANCLAQAIATAALSENEWSDGSGGFAPKTITFNAANHVLAVGRTLVLRLGVQQGSSTLVFAYGTTTHAAFLAVDVA